MGTLPILAGAILSDRNGFPEIAHKAALRVEVLDSERHADLGTGIDLALLDVGDVRHQPAAIREGDHAVVVRGDRKSTRLNSSHPSISYAVFCWKKKSTTSWCSASSWPAPARRPGRRVPVRGRA